MHDEDAGPFAGNGIVIREITFQCDVTLFVFDRLGHDFRMAGQRAGQRQNNRNEFFHNNQFINRKLPERQHSLMSGGLIFLSAIFGVRDYTSRA